jgi:hypothetical protein
VTAVPSAITGFLPHSNGNPEPVGQMTQPKEPTEPAVFLTDPFGVARPTRME